MGYAESMKSKKNRLICRKPRSLWALALSFLSVGGMTLQGELLPIEVMYNHPNGDDLEFIEFENRGSEAIDLTGAMFTDGITFSFESLLLDPGERFILAKDPFAFSSEYSDSNGVVVGGYDGQLSNKGEKLVLLAATGLVLMDFEYSDGGGWPSRADGAGSSLQLEDDETDINDSGSWQASERYGGAPGGIERQSNVSIVINEVLTHTDPPFQDAIELYNSGDAAVDLSGWFLSDSVGEFDRFEIPNGTVLGAKEYTVFYEQALNFENPGVPFSLSSAKGDNVILTSSDPSGFPLFFIDSVSFDAAANGFSFGRYPNGEGRLVTMSQQTLGTSILPTDSPDQVANFILGRGAENAEPLVGPVVISKIMYEPPAGKAEFVELTNLTPFELPLFDALATTNRWRLTGAVSFEFPMDVRIPPNGSVIVANTIPAVFGEQYPEIANDGVFGPYAGSLNNSGERIKVFRPDFPVMAPDPDAGFVPYYLAEEVDYDNKAPWPLDVGGTGAFLVRRVLADYGDVASNWESSSDTSGAGDQDVDQDGMLDDWETVNGLDPSDSADAGADPDGDGVSNLGEFQSATDPNDGQDSLRILSAAISGSTLVLSFEGRSGIEYTLESFSLPASAELPSSVETVLMTTSELVEISLPIVGESTEFFRVSAQRLP